MNRRTAPPTAADAVVVGAGIVGLALGWALAARGLAVAVLERGRIGGSTSAGTFAWVNATAKTEDPAYHRLNAAGLARHAHLAETMGGAAALHGAGALLWGEGAALERLRSEYARLRQLAYPAEWLEAAALAAKLPGLAVGPAAAGLLAPADRWLEVPRLVDWFVAEIERLGGQVLPGTPFEGLERGPDGRPARVRYPGGAIATGRLAIAAGAETPEVLQSASGGVLSGAAFPMRRVPGFLVETPPGTAPAGLELILHAIAADGFHLRPTAAGGLLLGADDTDASVGEGGDPAAIAAAKALLLRRAAAWFPGHPPVAIEATAWRIGRRALPADGHSIVGPLAWAPGLYVSVTHSGVTLAPWIGELLAGEMAGGPPAAALAAFRPARFGL